MLAEDSIQSLGGKARAEALDPDERSKIARKAAETRWGLPKATHYGYLAIGAAKIPCFVLDDGRRVISGRGLTSAIGMKGRGQGVTRIATHRLLNTPENEELRRAIESPIRFVGRSPKGLEAASDGYEATTLQEVCEAILRARDAGQLVTEQERRYAREADMLIRSFAKVGIIALVDEATGFQYDRAREALAEILEKFIAKELQEWTRTFPSEFYEQIFRLRNWKFEPANVARGRRPQVIGHYTNDIVYKRLAPGVLDELKRLSPKTDGRRKNKLFQWLTGDIGHPKLRSHIDGVLALMRVSDNWNQFKGFLKRAYRKYERTELGFDVEAMEKR